MQKLDLAVNLDGWRIYTRRQADPAFSPVAARVLTRDAYTCQYCSFQAHQYQVVVNADGNYNNNRLSNLVTACCFCAQCLFIESINMSDNGGGQLIFLPEISQADLNGFCHVLFCAMGNGTGYEEIAQSIYRDLKFRSQAVEQCFGSGTSQPSVFGQLVLECRAENLTHPKTFQGVRLLPAHEKFRVQLEAWAADALEELAEQPS